MIVLMFLGGLFSTEMPESSLRKLQSSSRSWTYACCWKSTFWRNFCISRPIL